MTDSASATEILAEVEALRPQAVFGSPWPTAGPIRHWGRDGEPDSMPIARDNAIRLLSVLFKAGVPRHQAVVSSFGNGMSTLLWAHLFERVLAVTPATWPDGAVTDGRTTVVSGSLDRTKFVYELLNGLDEINLLFLDETNYARAISPYYLFRKKLSRPGLIAFVGMRSDGLRRFVADLASGFLDGFEHKIVELPGECGVGAGYELVGP